MGRKRASNKHLPPRVYQKHGAFFYVDYRNKWHKLGKTFQEAMTTWANKFCNETRITLFKDALTRYLHEVAPRSSDKYYKYKIHVIEILIKAFGHFYAEEIKPQDIYTYMDAVSQKSGEPTANRHKEILSHVLTYCIRWGLISSNPCAVVKSFSEKPRSRYVTDEEFLAVKNIASPIMRHIMDFAYLTGLRRGDILSLMRENLTDEGIIIKTAKTDKSILIEWSSDLKALVSEIIGMRGNLRSLYLFCNRRGSPYTGHGISAMWQRLMNKALANNVIDKRFTFHDIRAKCASDIEDLGNASKLLAHSNTATTERVYRRKIVRVKPLK